MRSLRARDPSRRRSPVPTAIEQALADGIVDSIDAGRAAFQAKPELIARTVWGDNPAWMELNEAVLTAMRGHVERLTEALALQYRQAARVEDQALPLIKRGPYVVAQAELRPGFDLVNTVAQRWAETHAAELVSQVGIQSMGVLRDQLIGYRRLQMAPAQMARQLAAMPGFGLHRPFQRALDSRRNAATMAYLDARGLETRPPGERPGPPRKAPTTAQVRSAMEHARKLTRPYERQLVRSRALTMARTETLLAANAGKISMWRQRANDGLFDRSRALKIWHTGPIEGGTLKGRQVCYICLPLAGVGVPLDGSFLTDRGPLDVPPAHPNCRCTVSLQVDGVTAEPYTGPEQRAMAEVGPPPTGGTADEQRQWAKDFLGKLRPEGTDLSHGSWPWLNDSPGTVGRINEAAYRLAQRYPGMFAKAVSGWSAGPFGSNESNVYAKAFIHVPGGGRVDMNSDWLHERILVPGSFEDRLPVLDREQWGRTKGWHPPGSTNVEGVFNHEVGHEFLNEIQSEAEKGNSEDLRSLIDKVKEALHVEPPEPTEAIPDGSLDEHFNQIIGTSLDLSSEPEEWMWSYLGADQLASDLSVYAGTNAHEFVAEALSEFWSSPAPRPVARAIGQWFDERFRELTREQLTVRRRKT